MNWIYPAIVAVLWAVIRVTLPNVPIDLDFDTSHGTFFIVMGNYISLARGMAILDLLLAWFSRDNPGAVRVCLSGALCGIFFCVYLVFAYERYLHGRYPKNGGPSMSNYTPTKYATTLTLGLATVVFTVMGIVMVLA